MRRLKMRKKTSWRFAGTCVVDAIDTETLSIDKSTLDVVSEMFDCFPLRVNEIEREIFSEVKEHDEYPKNEKWEIYFEGHTDYAGVTNEKDRRVYVEYVYVEPYEYCENG
jgi:hypothetical protein